MPALSTQFTFIINQGSSSVGIPSNAHALDGSSLFKSNKEKGAGYYGASAGMHTVSYTVTANFAGTMKIQASLSTAPEESDWFDVVDTAVSYAVPIVPASVTTHYTNFVGNFVWVRAVVDRADEPVNGAIMWINYNH